MRYFLELSYNGKNFNGWQRQPSAPTVQQTVEEALSTLLGTPTEITGAGRTDTGVHAEYYVAHFDAISRIGNKKDFLYHLNALTGHEIAVFGLRAVADDAHARFDAISREYTYRIIPAKNPFRRDTSWQYYVPLDCEAMNDAAALLTKYDDFTSFAKLNSDNRTNICHVQSAHWQRRPDGELVFKIRSDRFLRNMIRALVGTMADVGRGKITAERFGQILLARDLSLSSASAPACGLFLTDVQYPENIYKDIEDI